MPSIQPHITRLITRIAPPNWPCHSNCHSSHVPPLGFGTYSEVCGVRGCACVVCEWLCPQTPIQRRILIFVARRHCYTGAGAFFVVFVCLHHSLYVYPGSTWA